MKKIWMLILIGLLALLTACGQQSHKSGSDNKTLIMGTSADYPPYEYIDTAKGQEPVGFDIDVAHHIAKKLGYKIKIQNMTFKGLIPALNTKRVDFVMAGMTPTPDREKSVDFSQTYYTAKQVILTKKDAHLQKISDFKGKTMGVQLGSIQQNLAEKLKKKTPMTVKTMDKATSLIEELKSNRIDGMIIEDAVAANILKDHPELTAFPIDSGNKSSGAAVAFPKKSSLKDQFNQELEAMKKDGSLKKLEKKWFKLQTQQ
jgi:polar amino acid transport system substrate-binding protein